MKFQIVSQKEKLAENPWAPHDILIYLQNDACSRLKWALYSIVTLDNLIENYNINLIIILGSAMEGKNQLYRVKDIIEFNYLKNLTQTKPQSFESKSLAADNYSMINLIGSEDKWFYLKPIIAPIIPKTRLRFLK